MAPREDAAMIAKAYRRRASGGVLLPLLAGAWPVLVLAALLGSSSSGGGGGVGPSLAAEPGIRWPVQAAPSPQRACRCRANGRSYELGERVCLKAPNGYRMAECRMVQNVTSWMFGSEDCVVSSGTAAVPGITEIRWRRDRLSALAQPSPGHAGLVKPSALHSSDPTP
jgi:hypothetical protein